MPMLKLYSIFDVKAASYSPPMCFENKLVASRFLSDEMSNPQSRMARHPADYDLREIGGFDSDAGAVIPHKAPLLVCTAAEIVAANSKETKHG